MGRISWEEAYDTIFARMTEIRRNMVQRPWFSDRAQAGMQGAYLAAAYAYGSPNWTLLGLSGISCFTPRLAGMYITEGILPLWTQLSFPLRYQDPEWTPRNV